MSAIPISTQISWVYTNNLSRSHIFYADLLGLQLLKDEGSARLYQTVPGAAIGVCEAFEDPDGYVIEFQQYL